MVQTFRRSLVGYDPKSLEDVLMRLKSEFNKRHNELKEQIAEEIHGLELIKLEIDHVNKGMGSSSSLKKEISEQLLSAHLGTITTIMKAMKDSELAENKAEELLRQKQSELDNLKNDLQKMRQELLEIAERYKLITDSGKESN